jgi:hypothetical protein
MSADTTTSSPIFIVGCSRSGTTLLRLMLTSHPDICIPPESDFIPALYEKWRDRQAQSADDIEALVADLTGHNPKLAEWKLDLAALRQRLAQLLPFPLSTFIAAVYQQYAAQFSPAATRWGDKNPQYCEQVGLILELFPSAKIIHIIRDGRAVYNSFIKANRSHGAVYPEAPERAARYWRNSMLRARRFQTHPHYLELRYESLVTNSEAELRRICDFLGITCLPEQMLNYPELNRSRELVPSSRLEWHSATLRSPDPAKISEWRSELTRPKTLAFELCAGHDLLLNGYELTFPASRSALLNSATRRVLKLFSPRKPRKTK